MQEHDLTSTLCDNLASLLCENLVQALERVLLRPSRHSTKTTRKRDGGIATDLSTVVLFLESESGNGYVGGASTDDDCIFWRTY